jgi:hypothetical protein
MFAATLGILEFQFRRVRIHGHTLTLGIRETLRLELRQRARLGTPVLFSPSVRSNRRGSQVSRMMFSRPYRYPRGFAARRPLNRDVAMTSNVKGWSPLFSGLHDGFWLSCIGRAGTSKIRRLILLLSVGW